MNFHILHHFVVENKERVQYNEISRRNAHLREQNKIFELPEDEFRQNFRLSREGFRILYDHIRDYLEEETRKGAVSRRLKVSRSTILNNFNNPPSHHKQEK